MSRKIALGFSIAMTLLVWAGFAKALAADDSKTKIIEVTITGGHDTDPRDHGRPVILVASALGVREQVFRDVFSHVKPAPAGEERDPEQVRRNKDALLSALSKYGVTNDRLDEVSNYYRYNRREDGIWKNKPAKIKVTIENGAFKKATIEQAGTGYTTAPTLSVPGYPGVKLIAKIAYGTDLDANGSVSIVTLKGDKN